MYDQDEGKKLSGQTKTVRTHELYRAALGRSVFA